MLVGVVGASLSCACGHGGGVRSCACGHGGGEVVLSMWAWWG